MQKQPKRFTPQVTKKIIWTAFTNFILRKARLEKSVQQLALYKNLTNLSVRISHIAKLGTKHERDTELGQYIDRRPKNSRKDTGENNHKKDLLRKHLGSIKIKRTQKQSNDISVISSGRSFISTSSNVARALKMRIHKRKPKHEAFQNRPDLKHSLL